MSTAYLVKELIEETLREIDQRTQIELTFIGREFLHWLDRVLQRMPCDRWRDDFDWFVAKLQRDHVILAKNSYDAWVQWLCEENESAKQDTAAAKGKGPSAVAMGDRQSATSPGEAPRRTPPTVLAQILPPKAVVKPLLTGAEKALLAKLIARRSAKILEELVAKGYLQVHHLVQQALYKGDGKLAKWLAKIAPKGAAENLIHLPTKAGRELAEQAWKTLQAKAAAGTLTPAETVLAGFLRSTTHEGGHLADYLKYLNGELQRIMKKNLSRAITDAEAQAAVRALQDSLREGLETGAIALTRSELGQAGLLLLGPMGTISKLSREEYDAKLAEFNEWYEGVVNANKMYDIYSLENLNKSVGSWLDIVNPLSAVVIAEDITLHLSLLGKPQIQALAERKMIELGLAIDPNQIMAPQRLAAFINGLNAGGMNENDVLYLAENNKFLQKIPVPLNLPHVKGTIDAARFVQAFATRMADGKFRELMADTGRNPNLLDLRGLLPWAKWMNAENQNEFFKLLLGAEREFEGK
jgi:hypothetical protein